MARRARRPRECEEFFQGRKRPRRAVGKPCGEDLGNCSEMAILPKAKADGAVERRAEFKANREILSGKSYIAV
jgi:hypothetical protein